MNKKFYFGLLAAGLMATAVATNVKIALNEKGFSDVVMVGVEALADNESDSGVRIYCRCNDGNIFGGNKQCKTNGKNAVCAQSEQGGNIDCATYNSNC
jgi:predicted transcriptional regulator